MVSRFARWYEEHPLAGDAALAAVLLLAFAIPADLSADTGAAADLAFSATLIACVPFRRLAPVAVFAAVSVICLAQLALLDHIVAAVALIALYTIAAYGPGIVVGAAATACTVAGAVLAAVRWDEHADRTSTLDVAASTVVSSLLALGAWRRSRRAELAALEERNRLLAIERDQQAAVGAAIERARIAASCTTSWRTRCPSSSSRPTARRRAPPPPPDGRLRPCAPPAPGGHRGGDARADGARSILVIGQAA